MSPYIDTEHEIKRDLQLVTEARDEWHRLFDEVNAKYADLAKVHAALLDERASVEAVVAPLETVDIAALKLDLAKADANAHVLLEVLTSVAKICGADTPAFDLTPSEALLEIARQAYEEAIWEHRYRNSRETEAAWEKSETLKKLKGAA